MSITLFGKWKQWSYHCGSKVWVKPRLSQLKSKCELGGAETQRAKWDMSDREDKYCIPLICGILKS